MPHEVAVAHFATGLKSETDPLRGAFTNYGEAEKALPNSLTMAVYCCGVKPVKRLNSLMK